MESRLLHQHGTPDTPRHLETLATAPSTPVALEGLSDSVGAKAQELVKECMENPHMLTERILSANGPNLMKSLQERSATLRDTVLNDRTVEDPTAPGGKKPVDGVRSILLQNGISNGPGTFADELGDIMDALGDIPDWTEGIDTTVKHRYLRASRYAPREEDAEAVTYYWLDFAKMDEDREHLERLKQIYPQHVEEFSALQDGIENIAGTDRRYAVHRLMTDNKSFTNEAFKHFGKTAAFAALSLAAILFGTISIINRKFDIKFLIAAGLAAIVGSSSLRRMIFGGEFENSLAHVETALNPGTITTMHEHGVKGSEWGNVATKIQNKDEEITAAVEALKARPIGMTDTEIAALAGSIVPAGDDASEEKQTAHTQLAAIMKEGRFPSFVQSIQSAKDPLEQEVILDFIKAGSAETVATMQKMEDATGPQPVDAVLTSPPRVS